MTKRALVRREANFTFISRNRMISKMRPYGRGMTVQSTLLSRSLGKVRQIGGLEWIPTFCPKNLFPLTITTFC